MIQPVIYCCNLCYLFTGKSHLFKLTDDEQWTLETNTLLDQLKYITMEEKQMPLEAVFDIRSPPGTHVRLNCEKNHRNSMLADCCNSNS